VNVSNAHGWTTASVSITVMTSSLAPYAFSYSSPAASYVINTRISANIPSVSGTKPFTYTISPSLPAGLTLNDAGFIKGTPTAYRSSTQYTVTVSNSQGSAEFKLLLAVVALAPSSFTYLYNPVSYVVGTALPNTVSITGTLPITYTVASGSLPAGLSLDATTGAITGTPTMVASGSVRIVASNAGGTTSVVLSYGVTTTPVAPSGLTYPSPVSYPSSDASTILTPSVIGSAPFTYTVTPSLPAGLSLNAVTGKITGAPTVLVSSTLYQVTATNSAGSTTGMLRLTCTVVAPQTILYASRFPAYTVGVAVSNTVTVTPSGTYTCSVVARWTVVECIDR